MAGDSEDPRLGYGEFSRHDTTKALTEYGKGLQNMQSFRLLAV